MARTLLKDGGQVWRLSTRHFPSTETRSFYWVRTTVFLPSSCPNHPTPYRDVGSRPKAWTPRRSSTVSSFFSVPATLLAYRSPYPPDDAFATKHMPDLGHDVKEFRVFHWKLQGWRRLGKKLTSAEFDCGGHKWYAQSLAIAVFSYSPRSLKTHSGEYFSSLPVIPMPPHLTPSLFISIMPTLTRGRVGTFAPNLHWSSQTLTTLPSIPSAVRNSQFK